MCHTHKHTHIYGHITIHIGVYISISQIAQDPVGRTHLRRTWWHKSELFQRNGATGKVLIRNTTYNTQSKPLTGKYGQVGSGGETPDITLSWKHYRIQLWKCWPGLSWSWLKHRSSIQLSSWKASPALAPVQSLSKLTLEWLTSSSSHMLVFPHYTGIYGKSRGIATLAKEKTGLCNEENDRRKGPCQLSICGIKVGVVWHRLQKGRIKFWK